MTTRQQLVGTIYALYADLGWAVPTSIEYAPIADLHLTIAQATATHTARNHQGES